MIKRHTFEVHGGRKEDPDRPGKSTWPDHIHLKISRFYAEMLVKELLNHLLDKEGRDTDFDYYTVGKIETDISED